LDELAAGVDDWYQAQVLPQLSNQLEYVGILVRKFDSHDGDLISTIHTSVFGGFFGDAHSANIADRIWFYSSRAPDRIRNSNFIPGVPKDVVELNTVNTSWRALNRDAYINLIDLAAGFGTFPAWRWVCASAWNNGTLRTTQRVLRTDLIRYLRPTVAQRRKRIPA
jgi:hypothetical protein